MRRIPALLCVAGLAAAPASAVAGPSSDPWSTESTRVARLPEPLIAVANALWSPFHTWLEPPPTHEAPEWLRSVMMKIENPKPAPATMVERLRSLFEPKPGPICRAQ